MHPQTRLLNDGCGSKLTGKDKTKYGGNMITVIAEECPTFQRVKEHLAEAKV
jgi:hypothetical protein